MRYAIALLALAIGAQAADIPIGLGNVKVKTAQQPAVIEWVNAQADLYTNTYEVVEGVTNTVPVVIPETPKEKVTRCFRATARKAIRKAVMDSATARAVHAAKQTEAFDDVED